MADAYALVIAALVVGTGLLFSVFMGRNSAKRGFKEDDALQTLGMTSVILGVTFADLRPIGRFFVGVGVFYP